jgi:23S rRNA G2069 N7-methylase RlmK/C1962 C5-methylase RlmI
LHGAIVELGKLLIDIYNDAGIINPKQAATSKQLAEQVKDAILKITDATTAVTVVDETVNVLLKQAAIQNGFGKIIKCGGDSSAL